MFVTHLESALDGTCFEPNRVHTVHQGRPLWVRYDLQKIAAVLKPDDLIGRPPSLWRYRELFYFFTWRDIKIKYKQTVLGFLWAILQPLLMMIIFTLFFGRALNIPSQNLPYPVYVFSGLLVWNLFSTGLTTASNSMVSNAPIIKKIYFLVTR